MDVPIGLLRLGMWDARYTRKYGIRCGAPLLNKDRGGRGLDLSSHERKGGSFKRINGTGKGKSYLGEGGLLLLLIFAEKRSVGPFRQYGCRK